MLKRSVHGTASLGASSHRAKTRGVKWQFHSIVGGGWFTSGSPFVLSGDIHTCCIVGNPPSRTSQAQTRRRAPRPNGKRKVRCAILWGIRSRSDVQGDGFQNLSRPRHSTFHRPWQCCSGCDVCGWIPIACVYVESLGVLLQVANAARRCFCASSGRGLVLSLSGSSITSELRVPRWLH